MTQTKKKYYEELNIFRAIIIIWVIIGHSFTAQQDFAGFLCHYAYSFHMKAFFILSGLLFAAAVKRIHSIKDAALLAGKRFCRIMVPFFFLTAVSYVLKFFMQEYAFRSLPQHAVMNTLLGRINPNGSLWFLYALFWLNITAILLHRLPDWLNVLIGAVLLAIYKLTPWLDHVIIGYIAEYAFYFFLGLFLASRYETVSGKVRIAFENRKTPMAALTMLFVGISFTVVYFHFIDKLHFPFFSVFVSLLNTVTAYLCAWLLSDLKPLKRLTMTIGNYGMDIYVIGYYVQITLRVILMSLLGLPYAVYSLAMCICGLFLPIPISKYIVRKFRITRILILGDYSKKEVKENVKKA